MSLVLVAAGLLLPLPGPIRPARLSGDPQKPGSSRYAAGGTRWMPSSNHEIVHFVCRPRRAYVIGLSSRGLGGRNGLDAATRQAYLHALAAAVRDWAERMECPTLRVELDPPYPDTLVRFGPIAGLHTLAVATRAGDVTVRSDRGWFPGSERQPKYLEGGARVSFYWVIAHELGHVFGVGHSDNPSSLMYPTQCATCRWSSFEQAAANVIHVASLDPTWSQDLPQSRFFVRTPVAVIPSLLSGALPEEALALLDPAAPENTCRVRPAGRSGTPGSSSPDPHLLKQSLPPPGDLEITASLHGTLWVQQARRSLAESQQAGLRRLPPPIRSSRPAPLPSPDAPGHAMVTPLCALPPTRGGVELDSAPSFPRSTVGGRRAPAIC